MEKPMIAALLEKYWQAETTVEEEQLLAEYFRQNEVPVEWEEYREIFGFFAAERKQVVSGDFERQLLERIAGEEAAPVRMLMRRAPWWAAAAVIVLGLGGALWLKPPEAGGGEREDAQLSSTVVMKDTYEDPQEAMAAIRKALMKVSTNINKGKNITRKELHQFNKIQYAINY